MALLPLYSRRKRLAAKTGDDVYQYEEISSKLRQQLLYVIQRWDERLAQWTGECPVSSAAASLMKEELGRANLDGGRHRQGSDEFNSWFKAETETEWLLDAIEICIQIAANRNSQHYKYKSMLDEDIQELNARFLEDGFGFQIEDGQLIQISSTFVHKEVTVPALGLLADPAFANANEEFRHAYQEFNQGNYDDCLHDCCNAFESVLKIILTQKGWAFDEKKDTAHKLISIAFDNKLIPEHMQNAFNGLRTMLESGVPTTRNKTPGAGHGSGTAPRTIPKHIAAYQLHQTAAAIVLLVEASKSRFRNSR